MNGSGDLRRLLIVVAEDQRMTRNVLRAVLTTRFGVGRVVEASTGEEALERCKESTPDVVLMDIDMPGIDGFEATRRILAQYPAVNVVGYSSHESAEVRDKMRAAGAVAYVDKSEPFEKLVETLNAFRS